MPRGRAEPTPSGDDRGTAAADIDFKDYLLSGPRSDELITDRSTDRGREVDLSG